LERIAAIVFFKITSLPKISITETAKTFSDPVMLRMKSILNYLPRILNNILLHVSFYSASSLTPRMRSLTV